MRALVALGLAAVALASSACDKRREPPPPEAFPGAPGPAPSQSVISIANVFGTCEDAGGCASDCDAGDADQCRKLGVTYQFGTRATVKDEAHAAQLFEQACALKSAGGCVSSGQMYEFHHGVDKDDTRAAHYYEKGCELGSQVGCANWAIMLENGRGVTKDIPRATALYEEACRRGAGLACDRLRALDAGAPARDAGR